MTKKSTYTYERFLAAAKESNDCRSRFIDKNRRMYEYAKTVGWYNNYPWKEHPNNRMRRYVVYCYKDTENMVVYVGLTSNLKKRRYGHHRTGSVHDYFLNRLIPEPEVLMCELTASEAKEQECAFLETFKKQGWVTLNKAKTGAHSSSLGGGYVYLTYEVCYDRAKKYKTKADFQRNDVSAYRKSLDNGWLDGWFRNVDRKKWTRERCYEEAIKYRTKSEFRCKNQSAYNSALNNKWLTDYYWFVKTTRKPKWNEESCLKAAKKCKSKTEFANKFSSAYKMALKNGWIHNYAWFMDTTALLKNRQKWTFATCRQLASKYNTRWAFGKENSGAYHACLRNHWLDSFEWFNQ